LQPFFVWCAPFGYLYFYFFSIVEWTRIGYFNQHGMALTPFPSSLEWDEIRTHNLSTTNLVCYPLDQAFAYQPFLLVIHPIVKLYNEYEISIVFIYLILYFNIWRHTYKYSTAQKCVVAHWLRDTDVMTCHLGPKVKQYFGCLKM